MIARSEENNRKMRPVYISSQLRNRLPDLFTAFPFLDQLHIITNGPKALPITSGLRFWPWGPLGMGVI
jgi:hypothetical protein